MRLSATGINPNGFLIVLRTSKKFFKIVFNLLKKYIRYNLPNKLKK